MKKSLVAISALMVLVIVGLWLVWEWGFCRFYVPADHMAVIIAKAGTPLEPGQILAHKGQQGVQEDVLGEGRHFLNPYYYEHTIEPVVSIAPGKVGLVTAKVGRDLPQGEFLASPGQKGIWHGVLGPGKYRINPVGYLIDTVDAISIPIGYVGVVTSLAGEKAPEGQFAGPNQKGIREDVLQPGLYYVNPKEFKVDILEVGINQVSMLGKTGSAVITKGNIVSQNAAMNTLNYKALETQYANRAKELAEQGAQVQIAQAVDHAVVGGGHVLQPQAGVFAHQLLQDVVQPLLVTAPLGLDRQAMHRQREIQRFEMDVVVVGRVVQHGVEVQLLDLGDGAQVARIGARHLDEFLALQPQQMADLERPAGIADVQLGPGGQGALVHAQHAHLADVRVDGDLEHVRDHMLGRVGFGM